MTFRTVHIDFRMRVVHRMEFEPWGVSENEDVLRTGAKSGRVRVWRLSSHPVDSQLCDDKSRSAKLPVLAFCGCNLRPARVLAIWGHPSLDTNHQVCITRYPRL
jgi:hypothetical protein